MRSHTSFRNIPVLKPGKFFFAIALAFLFTVSLLKVSAQGNLLITPRRIVFEGNMKTAELNLANTGKDTARYNVSIVQYRMKEDGSFEEITEPDPGQNFADKYIRFFPRSVTLAPNEAQVVKMQLTKTNMLTPGEYRSHVYFRAVPKERALGEEEPASDSTGISVRLVPIFGITIPVIIRVGESDTKVNLSDIAVDMANDTLPRLKFTFNRTGNMSVYGDIAVLHTSPSGKTTEVGIVKGIAVYTPNSLRRFQMDLKKPDGLDFHQGKLSITFTTQSDTKPQRLTEAELILK
ncbi:MAG: molecular chaperone [Bacteroidales bacterium]|nr:molecular chaperone [Bacteroidales bacterium]